MAIVINALKTLGIKSTTVRIKIVGQLAIVKLDDQYFGIYDLTKQTFVD